MKNYYKISVLFFVILAVGMSAFIYPVPFNRAIGFINQRTGLKIATIPEISFKLGLDLQGGTQLIYQADLSEIPEGEREQRMRELRDLIERRVDLFGVAEPLVQVKGERLIVELAGVVDMAAAMRMIGETPFLEFKELKEGEEPTLEEEELIKRKNEEARQRAVEILKEIRAGANFKEMAISHSDDPGSAAKGGDLGRFGKGVMVPEFESAVFALQEGEISDIVETDFGYHIIQKNSRENEAGEIAASHILIAKESPQGIVSQWRRTELGGEHLETARFSFDRVTRDIIIELRFTSEGAIIFEQITERNIGRPLAILLDGQSIIDTTGDGEITEEDLYAPTVQNKISGGEAVITGEITLENARKIVSRLRSGALPVPIQLISYQKVGPALGIESLEQSLMAGIWGFLLLALFLIIVYRFSGLLAIFSLFFYIILVLAIFKALPVTLTLSGIAGFILSIGMAVDANVLTFSRIKEEVKSGKGFKESIDSGFERSWPPVRDGNLTTLIVAFILFFMGTSFVKGFALTLIIGLLVSLFSAMIVTKCLFKAFEGTRWETKKQLWL